jgi:hypothetical protein
MNDIPSVGAEVARNVPLTAGAVYLSFISTYGTAIVTTLAIAYGVMQMYLRWKEHKAIMRKNDEEKQDDESGD